MFKGAGFSITTHYKRSAGLDWQGGHLGNAPTSSSWRVPSRLFGSGSAAFCVNYMAVRLHSSAASLCVNDRQRRIDKPPLRLCVRGAAGTTTSCLGRRADANYSCWQIYVIDYIDASSQSEFVHTEPSSSDIKPRRVSCHTACQRCGTNGGMTTQIITCKSKTVSADCWESFGCCCDWDPDPSCIMLSGKEKVSKLFAQYHLQWTNGRRFFPLQKCDGESVGQTGWQTHFSPVRRRPVAAVTRSTGGSEEKQKCPQKLLFVTETAGDEKVCHADWINKLSKSSTSENNWSYRRHVTVTAVINYVDKQETEAREEFTSFNQVKLPKQQREETHSASVNSYKKYKSIKHNAVKSNKVWEETSELERVTVLRCDNKRDVFFCGCLKGFHLWCQIFIMKVAKAVETMSHVWTESASETEVRMSKCK